MLDSDSDKLNGTTVFIFYKVQSGPRLLKQGAHQVELQQVVQDGLHRRADRLGKVLLL